MTHRLDYDYLFKILLIGDSGVGKSSLLHRYVDDTFSESFLTTIGVDFKIRTIGINDKTVKLQVWDCAGQERFRSITTSYYRGADGILVVYDVTNQESFDNIKNWMNEAKRFGSKTVRFTLIGNKADRKHTREISFQQGSDLAKELDIPFVEASAQNSNNVDRAFMTLGTEIFDHYRNIEEKTKNNVKIGQGSSSKPVHHEETCSC